MMGFLVLARSKWKYGVALGLLLWTGALLFHSANSINVASPHLENSVTTADENEVFEKQYDEDRSVDPSNYFSGALPRPVIEIVKPQHGEELQLNEVKILVEVKDYDLPSPLHDTKMCIGLADGQTKLFEKCFDQLKIMDFFVSGMEPGEYQLRAALTEKGEALAVAMRAFTIVGVPVPGAGPDGGEARVSLRTALEVALDHHQQGQHSLAETVYQRIVDLFPHHGDALHLLGIIHYQKGDPAGAIDLLERAVAAVNLGSEGTGLDAALAQALNQLDHSGGAGSGGDGEGPPSASSEQQANFHNSLGECLRAVGRVRESLEHYRRAIELRPRFFLAIYNLGLAMQQLGDLNQAAALYMKVLESPKGAAEGHILRDARVRLCDLQSALGDRVGARACWEKGIKRWPKDGLMYNELGSLAIQGPERDVPLAREYFESAFHFGYALSELNIAICMEFLGETAGARARYAAVAQKLAARNPENPTGHIRIKAATLLPPLVPPDPAGGGLGARRALQDVERNLDDLLTAPWDHHDNTEPLRHAFPTGMGFLWYGAEGGDAEVKRKLGAVYTLLCPALLTGRFFDADDLAPTGNQIIYDMDVRYIGADPENNGFDGKQFKLMPPETHLFHKPKNKTVEEDDVLVPEPRRPGPLRVGVVTRFLAGAHPNGLLALGLLRELARLEKYELYAFLIQTFPEDRHDPRWQQALKYVHEGVIVPESLKVALQRVKDRYPDVLVYPEVGPDPVQYFMSFCRAAPVQAAWWGHPDTTGSPNIDWFVTSSIELPGVEKRYSEKPWLMEGLGAYFIRPELLHDLDPDYYRNLFVRQLNLPPNFHFYYVAAPIERMHPLFVEAIAEILEKDKLGFALVPNSRFEPQWFQEFERRYGRPRAARMLFFGTSGEQEDLALMESSEVVLEPFPSAHFYPALQALSLGVPLVAKVGATLAGRTTLAMYRKLGVGDLLAATAQEYVQTALKVALAPNYRAQLSSRILAANYKLFEDTSAVHEWEKFLTMVGAPLLSGEQPILIRRTHLTPEEEAAARERAGKPRAGLWRGNKPGEAPEDLLAAQQQQRQQQEAEEERERRGGALPEAEGAAVVGGGGGAAEALGAADAGSPGGGRNDAPDAVAVVVGEEEEGQGGGGTVDHHTTTYMRVTPTKPSHQKQGQEWSPPPASDDAATAIKRDGPTTAGSREEEDAMTKKVRISTSPTEGKQHGHQSHNHQLHHKHHTSAEGEEHAPALDYLGTDEIKFEKRHNSKARRRKKREHISDDTTEGRGGGENEESNFVKHQQQQHQDEL